MSVDGEGGPEKGTVQEAPRRKTGGVGRLLLGVLLGVVLTLVVLIGIGHYVRVNNLDGASGPERVEDAGGLPSVRPAEDKAPAWKFAFRNPFARHPADDGKICVKVRALGAYGQAYVDQLKSAQPDWIVWLYEEPADCAADFFVTLWGSDVETHDYEYGGFFARDTVNTYSGYVGVQAVNAPGHSATPMLWTVTDSSEDEVIEELVESLAKEVQKSGPGRQGRFKIAGAEDGKTCVSLTARDKIAHNAAASMLQFPDREIWVLNYMGDKHNEKTCPIDFYVSYQLSASKSGQWNVGYATALAALGKDVDFPALSVGYHRHQERSENVAFKNFYALLGKGETSEQPLQR